MSIADIRASKILDKQMNYGKLGIMTRREFVEYANKQGWQIDYSDTLKSWFIGKWSVTKTEIEHLGWLREQGVC